MPSRRWPSGCASSRSDPDPRVAVAGVAACDGKGALSPARIWIAEVQELPGGRAPLGWPGYAEAGDGGSVRGGAGSGGPDARWPGGAGGGGGAGPGRGGGG